MIELAGRYDLRLVALSVIIAILAAGAALDLAGRVAATRGRARAAWLAGGAFAMGLGIWSMHYVGMLAFQLPIPVRYDVPTVLASLAAAVFASAVALFVVSRPDMGPALGGSVVMGGGIATMHYTGMAAMRMAATTHYDPLLFTLSIVIAIAVSLVALLLAFHLRAATVVWDWRKFGSALLMGLAIPAMHYTGMAAASFTPSGAAVYVAHSMSISALGLAAITSSTFMVLALALGTSMLDRRLSAHAGTLARFAAVVQSTDDAILAAGRDGRVTAWNAGAERLLGYRGAEVLGRPVSLLVPQERVGEAHARLEQVLREGRAIRYETLRRRKDGTLVDVAITASPIVDRTGHIAGVSAIMRDITAAKHAEAALREARDLAERTARARSAFLANMSHEIRTPMNAVVGMVELVLDTELTSEQRRALDLVRSSAEALLAVLNDILDYSKIEAEHLELEAIPFDLPKLVHATVSLLAVRARSKHLELIADVERDVPAMVRGDPTRLRQVLTNLIGNAIKFTEEGEVAVSVTATGPTDGVVRVCFTVRDTGIGIAPDQLQTIFQEFQQADVSMTRRYGGTGLGLAISRRLVGRMGGEISVKSQVGRGSEFAFTVGFPVEAGPARRSLLPEHVPPGSRRVLVVDDNETNRRILRDMLAAEGMVVGEAASADAALETLYRAHRNGAAFDLAIIDAQMPDRDGFELAGVVRADPALGATRLCMLTSAGQRGDGERCRELGIRGYLTKPISRAELVEAVAVVLADTPGEPSAVVTRHTIREARQERRILLAEDNPVNQEVATAMLVRRGHRVDVVATGRAAVEAVERGSYDVVLMDIQMPDMDGFAATAAIRRLPGGHDLPIYALTAHAVSGERERCLAQGMNGYLAKPFKGHELYDLVEGDVPAAAATPGPKEVAPAAVDLDEFRTVMRVAGAEDAVEGILDTFLQHAEARIATLAAAVAAGDADGIARAAHAFKSAAGSIHARALAMLLQDIEQVAKRGDLKEARARLDAVRSATAAVVDALRAARAGSRSPA